MVIYLVAGVGAYLLGSVPFGYLLLRVFRGTDVRATGSGNIGATNVARSAPGLGALTLILDAAKGFTAVMGGMALASSGVLGDHPPAVAAAIAAIFAILGHVF